ncbi:unnamed protein product [Miscanthus lutarioriparius]|uniref:Uncharacterized protein n=1 Tax=Miscanthus lutarioriparius TaxID=422564 RepID=A0A811RA93_9POAL|nr:unnamed protein product [Miscanthus lutarioriparius]
MRDPCRRDLDPPPWPHPPWLTTRPQACAWSASQGRASSSSPPGRGEVGEKATRGARVGDWEALLENIWDDEVIVKFFGQLWAIDSPPPRNPRVRPSNPIQTSSTNSDGRLFWIRQDLVESRQISPEDCFPSYKRSGCRFWGYLLDVATGRIKVAYRDSSKIPKDRLHEMNKSLFVVSFEVEGAQATGPGPAGNDGNGGDDDDKKKDNNADDDEDDLLDDDDISKDQPTGSKHTTIDGEDARVIGSLKGELHIGAGYDISAAGLNLVGESSKTQQVTTLGGPSEDYSCVTPEMFRAYQTPKATQAQNTECPVVGNKFFQPISEESHHSKWEEFRKMAQSDNMIQDCSILLRRMELEDSESEGESAKFVMEQDDEVLSLGDLGKDSQAEQALMRDLVSQMKDVQSDASPDVVQVKKICAVTSLVK